MTLQRAMGLYWLGRCACPSLGIKVIKVAFRALRTFPVVENPPEFPRPRF
jgi:hypothetical protein